MIVMVVKMENETKTMTEKKVTNNNNGPASAKQIKQKCFEAQRYNFVQLQIDAEKMAHTHTYL